MQVVAIYAGVDTYSQKLDYIFNIFNNTCNEIGINIQKIDITKFNIDNFSGKKLTIVNNIFNNIINSSAVIFVCTSKLLAPCGAMQSFLEHFDYDLYQPVLQNKLCYTIITSTDGSEFNAGNYIQTVISLLGGTSIGSMLIGQSYLDGIENSFEITHMIERYAEDFYRLLKQNRKLFQITPFNLAVKKTPLNNNSNEIENNLVNSLNSNLNNNLTNSLTNNLEDNLHNSLYKEGQIQRELDLKDLNFTNNQINKNEKVMANSVNQAKVTNLYQREFENQQINNQQTNQLNKQTNLTQNTYNTQNQNLAQDLMQNLNQNLNQNLGQNLSQNYKNYANYPNYQAYQTDQYIKNNQSNQTNQDQGYLGQIESFNENQNDDISEITKLLSKQYQINSKQSYNENQNEKILNGGNCKQRIQSLYHYFQPQIANDMSCIIQLNVSGDENFNGYFDIKNGDCVYNEGIHPAPEVIINSDSRVLWDVLTSKYTLQKAFMLGKIKVKGNFVIISKFEQIFKFA